MGRDRQSCAPAILSMAPDARTPAVLDPIGGGNGNFRGRKWSQWCPHHPSVSPHNLVTIVGPPCLGHQMLHSSTNISFSGNVISSWISRLERAELLSSSGEIAEFLDEAAKRHASIVGPMLLPHRPSQPHVSLALVLFCTIRKDARYSGNGRESHPVSTRAAHSWHSGRGPFATQYHWTTIASQNVALRYLIPRGLRK